MGKTELMMDEYRVLMHRKMAAFDTPEFEAVANSVNGRMKQLAEQIDAAFIRRAYKAKIAACTAIVERMPAADVDNAPF
jgi:DNA-binding transcriptional regulator YbjK